MLYCSFLSQKLDDQDIYLLVPQRPTVSIPSPQHISETVLSSAGWKVHGVQRYLSICESNTMDTSEHLNRAEYTLI